MPFETATVSAAALPEHPDTDEPDSNKTGEFAQILAGMLRETGVENTQKPPDDNAADNVSLAEANEILIEKEPEENILVPEQKLLAGVFGKPEEVENGFFTEEINLSDSTANDQNILLSAEMILNRTEGLKAVDDEPDSVYAEFAVDPTERAADELPEFLLAEELDFTVFPGYAEPAIEAAENYQADAREKSSGIGKIPRNEEAAQPAYFYHADEDALALKNSESRKGRPEEVRGKERRQDRAVIEVRDYRTGQAGGDVRGLDMRINAATRPDAANETELREITLELRLPDQGQKAPSDTNWGIKSANAFEDLLSRELHQNFNNDIVRHASMILRDEGKGMIRLALKPDSLGHVKICLEMAENKITGHIIVESEEALRAFEKEIHSLEKAFKESGFQDACLSMSLTADGRGAEQSRQWAQARTLLSGLDIASRYDAQQAEMPLIAAIERGQTTINMLA